MRVQQVYSWRSCGGRNVEGCSSLLCEQPLGTKLVLLCIIGGGADVAQGRKGRNGGMKEWKSKGQDKSRDIRVGVVTFGQCSTL